MTPEESVIKFLDSFEDLGEYFEYCYSLNKKPKYYELQEKYLIGNTKEGIDFSSPYIKYSNLSKYLEDRYESWKETMIKEGMLV